MEYLELIFKAVELDNIKPLLSTLSIIHLENIQDSHFYSNRDNIFYSDDLNFLDYYSCPATGMIKSDYADIGIRVFDVITVISGCSPSVEIVVNFKKIDFIDFSYIYKWIDSNVCFAEQIIFGIEPVETSDEILYTAKRYSD